MLFRSGSCERKEWEKGAGVEYHFVRYTADWSMGIAVEQLQCITVFQSKIGHGLSQIAVSECRLQPLVYQCSVPNPTAILAQIIFTVLNLQWDVFMDQNRIILSYGLANCSVLLENECSNHRDGYPLN